MGPLTNVFRGRSNSSTPPRAVYNDLHSAHSNITGRAQAPQGNWPSLSPGWAGDQPATAGNPWSTPISQKARTTSGDLTVSPLARRTRASRPAPVGSPEIPESELGTRFPNVSPPETRADARILWPERGVNDSSAARRRSRSVGDFSIHWYEAIYGSRRPLSPTQHQSPSAPTALEESPFHSASHPLLQDFRFPSNDGVNPFDNIVRVQGSPRGIPAHSTISDIVNSYSDENRQLQGRANPAYNLANSSSNNPYHQRRQLSQTAWSPRPSNEGAGFTHEIRSVHGSIHNVDDDLPDQVGESSSDSPDYHATDREGHNADQDVIDQVFNPQAGHADRGAHATAYATLVRPNGQTMSRGLSRAELMRYEQLVQSHVRNPSNPNIFDAGSYTHEGRLSLEYPRPLPEDFDIDRSYSLSSSSTSIGSLARRQTEAQAQGRVARQGTPPLLFGTNAVGYTNQAPSASFPTSNDEGDWETVGGLSRQETRGVASNTQGNNSSFADYSSSSTGMRQTGLPPGGQVLQQPAHPRYVHSWNMYQDQQSGQPIMIPETGTPIQGANSPGHTLSSPVPRKSPNYQYQHPSPLSEGHTNPFTSSPVSGKQGSISQYSGDNSASAGESEGSFLEMSPSAKKQRTNQLGHSSGKDNSSAWVSTEEGPQDIGIKSGAQQGSFAQPNFMGLQGNITGTPQGTGARELGSSIANGSSPGVNFSSSPYVLETDCQELRAQEPSREIHRSMSGDSCLSSLSTTLSTTDSYRIHRQETANRRIDGPYVDPKDFELTALPSFADLPADARFHRQQLIDHGLLPRDSPPFSVRRSFGLEFLKDSPSKIKKATAATGANIGRHFQQFVPTMPTLSHVRRRSPHRRDTDDNNETSDIEMQSSEPHRGRQFGSRRNKDNTKSKVSDSEGSADSDVGLTSTTHHQPATDPGMSTAIEPVELEGVIVHPTHTDISHGQANTAQNLLPVGQTQPEVQAHLPPIHGNNTQYNLRRLLGPPSVEEMLAAVRDNRPTPRVGQMNRRPIARAESPHLYRVPRPTSEALMRRHKELGRVFLVVCSMFGPVSLFYAAGYFDQVMDMLTRGELTEMPSFEKKIAWVWGTVSFVGLTIFLPVCAIKYGWFD